MYTKIENMLTELDRDIEIKQELVAKDICSIILSESDNLNEARNTSYQLRNILARGRTFNCKEVLEIVIENINNVVESALNDINYYRK